MGVLFMLLVAFGLPVLIITTFSKSTSYLVKSAQKPPVQQPNQESQTNQIPPNQNQQ